MGNWSFQVAAHCTTHHINRCIVRAILTRLGSLRLFASCISQTILPDSIREIDSIDRIGSHPLNVAIVEVAKDSVTVP